MMSAHSGGPIRWFVDNPIAANLLMMLLIIGGILGIPALNKQYFPEFEINTVAINMAYPGAGPVEVEEQISIRVEEAIHDLNGIKEITSTSRQGSAQVMVEAETGYDMQRLTSDIKTRVDSINTFPVEAERPVINQITHRNHMITVSIAGDIGERNLKVLAEQLRDELASLPHVSVVEITSPRAYELSVEVSEYTLRHYGLTLSDVAAAIRGSSLNLPAGSIKTSEGDIQLQTRGQAYEGADFESIPLLTSTDGTQLVLGDVATIIDGFQDTDVRTRFNDKASHDLHVFVTSNPNVLKTSKTVHAWAEGAKKRLPPGVEMKLWRDSADPFNARVETLMKNGIGGLVLVFAVLVLFLRPLLALWVCVGIAVAFLGTFFILPYTGTSLNMISLFAFLLILGIVVDDAIIVGEAIHSRQMDGESGAKGAVLGARSVVKPVMYAVISTMIFFMPMFFMPGNMAHAAKAIPTVVIIALTFSLIECLLILPPHLAHMRPPRAPKTPLLRQLEIARQRCAKSMTDFAANRYRPFLARCLRNSQVVGALFLVALLLSLALYGGGWVRKAFFPTIHSDFVEAEIALPEGLAFRDTLDLLQQVESAAASLKERYNADPYYAAEGPALGHITSRGQENEVRVQLEVMSDRVDSQQLAEDWREQIGEVGEVQDYRMDYTINDRGKPIKLDLSADSLDDLRAVSAELQRVLQSYPDVYNVYSSLQSPKDEIVLDLKPAAENLSVTLAGLAQQVREAFYGAEAQRIPREKEDVRVMVRYPERERVAVENLSDMRIRTPAGAEVPFDTVAEMRYEPGYLTIDRQDRNRTLEVTAELVEGGTPAGEIVQQILQVHLPKWRAEYPSLQMGLDGELQEEQEFMSAMLRFMGLAMLVIYALMAIPFRSYWQPLLVLTAVPFGIMGAIFGHMILNWQISIFSLMGVIACSGVVVNDNLVLIDRINQLRATGHSVMESLLQGGEDRFRPIILTSLTTFIGLLPIMSETSVQAQFLIPMVTSLAFGVLFATGVTLVLVPCLYLLGDQFSHRVLRIPTPAADKAAEDSAAATS